MTQLLAVQDMLVKDCLNKDTTPTARSLCARGFEALERLKRDMRMQPKPKPVEVQAPGKRGKASAPMFTPPAETPDQPAKAA